MDDTLGVTEAQAWKLIDGLRRRHGLVSSSTPAGVLLEHPEAGALSLSLWDSRHDLRALQDWLGAAGLETAPET